MFFCLTGADDEFRQVLRHFAAARELSLTAGAHRAIYDQKAGEHLKTLTKWLRRTDVDQHRGHLQRRPYEAGGASPGTGT